MAKPLEQWLKLTARKIVGEFIDEIIVAKSTHPTCAGFRAP